MNRMHLIQQQRDLGIRRYHRVSYTNTIDIGFFQAFLQFKLVTHGGNTTVDSTGAQRNQDRTLFAKLLKHLDIFCIGHATLYDADITFTHGFDISNRAAIKFNQRYQFENAFINVEERHMAAKTAA